MHADTFTTVVARLCTLHAPLVVRLTLHLIEVPDFSMWRFYRRPKATSAGVMFCQMQQLCSLTSMTCNNPCSFYGQRAPPPSSSSSAPRRYNQSASGNDEQYACCVSSVLSATVLQKRKEKKKCCTVSIYETSSWNNCTRLFSFSLAKLSG